VHPSTTTPSLIELRNPNLQCICAGCGRPFERKNLPHALLSTNGKFLCMEHSREMHEKCQFHVFHSYCIYSSECCEQEEESEDDSAKTPTRIGLDVGGVIVPGLGQENNQEDTLLSDNGYKKTKPMPDCVDVAKRLVERLGADNVLIVSKAGERVEHNTRKWLSHSRFLKKTGIPQNNVHFVRERKDKGPLCAELGVNAFVDDNLSVLQHFEPGTRLFYFRASDSAEDSKSALYYHPDVEICCSWKELETCL